MANQLQYLHGDYDRRLAVLEEQMETLLGNGQPGRISNIEAKLASHDKWFWISMGCIMGFQFLSGNGMISLSKILNH